MSRDYRTMLVVFVSCFASVVLQSCALPVEVNASGGGGGGGIETVPTREVPYGETVTLLCRSNDENHNFMYWYMEEKNTKVGPGKSYDNAKFRYQVLSGNLTIKAVSDDDEGLYSCVSRGVRNDNINIRSVRMIVTKDWDKVHGYDSNVNTFRRDVVIFTLTTLLSVVGLVIICTLTILSVVGYLAYKIYKNRFRNPSHLVPSNDEDDDRAARNSPERRNNLPATTGSVARFIKLQALFYKFVTHFCNSGNQHDTSVEAIESDMSLL